MSFRKLRIAWSTFCVVACVLLIALWVRSYWWIDTVGGDHGRRFTSIGTNAGKIGFLHMRVLIGMGLNFYSFRVPDNLESEADSHVDAEPANHPLGFEWNAFRDGLIVTVPCWFPVLLSSVLVFAPWIRWSNRFSLRTLLIAMTLVAVVLGAIVWSMR